MRLSILAAALALALVAPRAPRAHADEPDKKEQARAAFDVGLGHFDRGEWSAALADFQRSRALFPTRSATINASICLRKEGRYDEALDLVDELLRSFPDLPPADRAFADAATLELRPLVGTIEILSEPGAFLVIDGRDRGLLPMSAPVRVSAGAHVVRVHKNGFAPIDRRVDVAGRHAEILEVKLLPLTTSGELVVTEASERVLDVLVDGVVVGKTPFSGRVATGRHSIALRGEGDLGTPPADATVDTAQPTRISLAAEELDSVLRVMPTPANALVSIDGVVVGNGAWEGRLRAGKHTIEIAAEGFLPVTREEGLVHGERSSLAVTLERDVASSAFRAKNPPRIFGEVEAASGVGVLYGGDVRAGCASGCTAAVPTLLGFTLHAGYQLPAGLLLGLDAGLLAFSAGVSGRSGTLTPRGLAPASGQIDDDLYLRGVRVGPSVGYRFPVGKFTMTARLGAGAFFGTGGDNRRGAFTTSAGVPYTTRSSESSRALYAWGAPEVRAALPVAERVELSLGVAVLLLAALDAPTWTDSSPVLAAPAGQRGDGAATYGQARMAGALILGVAPSVGVRGAF